LAISEHATKFHPNFAMLQCELLATLIVKFDVFAKSFSNKPIQQKNLTQIWDLIPWIKKPKDKSKHSLLPWLDK